MDQNYRFQLVLAAFHGKSTRNNPFFCWSKWCFDQSLRRPRGKSIPAARSLPGATVTSGSRLGRRCFLGLVHRDLEHGTIQNSNLQWTRFTRFHPGSNFCLGLSMWTGRKFCCLSLMTEVPALQEQLIHVWSSVLEITVVGRNCSQTAWNFLWNGSHRLLRGGNRHLWLHLLQVIPSLSLPVDPAALRFSMWTEKVAFSGPQCCWLVTRERPFADTRAWIGRQETTEACFWSLWILVDPCANCFSWNFRNF